ncbi:unnamed protein product [Eruca vesicaria subsp. sativa]|uniref:Uncharacterized protein n=1 Tax=Eruca vesicaria subsp. sativa TaxID=29727 RepID=A0ABC8J498_ERUVS|nr:unnamed protein product [Eruca vesicaria subsp. sativa]
MITSTNTIHLNRFQVLQEEMRRALSQKNSWPGHGSYPTQVPITSIQFNTAYASSMAFASLSPSRVLLPRMSTAPFSPFQQFHGCRGEKTHLFCN